MSTYRQIHTRTWSSDSWFSSLSPQLKLLFIYLFSNERASACGLYELPLRVMSFETGLLREEIQHGFEVFTKADKAKYDPETGVVWVRNMFKYQSSSSPKLRARIEADIKAVPDCDLKREALAYLAPLLRLPSPGAAVAPAAAEADTVPVGYDHHNDTPLSVSVHVHDPLSGSGSVSEGEGVQGEGEPATATRAVLQAYQHNIGALTPMIADGLKADLDEYPADWVVAAIEYAARREKRSLAYVDATLKGWRRDGLTNPNAKMSKRENDEPPEMSPEEKARLIELAARELGGRG